MAGISTAKKFHNITSGVRRSEQNFTEVHPIRFEHEQTKPKNSETYHGWIHAEKFIIKRHQKQRFPCSLEGTGRNILWVKTS
jgi:hypothetical protein